jgi:hypothetical protein
MLWKVFSTSISPTCSIWTIRFRDGIYATVKLPRKWCLVSKIVDPYSLSLTSFHLRLWIMCWPFWEISSSEQGSNIISSSIRL